eukprot:GHVL01034807.1.p1 GENE.GHVL01034807.1~~GHVL01034807.1.p1  ORF type:complete len:460 (-),score=50.69 GHVL01034807.1:719-2098(-)
MIIRDIVKYIMPIVPEVRSPARRISLREKVMWTMGVLLLYLLFSKIPIYGANHVESMCSGWTCLIIGTSRGTLLELGISYTFTSTMLIQFLAGYKYIKLPQNTKEDRAIYSGTQKLFGIFICLFQAILSLVFGYFGQLTDIGAVNSILIIIQLLFTGILIILFDELLQKGYGLGSGISLFIATNICQSIVWKAFSPYTINTANGIEYEGAVIALFHNLILKSDKVLALQLAFYRSYAPNITSLLGTVVMFFIVIYFQGFRIDLGVTNQKVRGQHGSYPIKLFYTSNIAIILQTAVVSNFYFFSQILNKRFESNFIVNLIGQWNETGVPVAGLAYYMSPPLGIWGLIRDPVHVIIYIIFFVVSCAIFSKAWIDVSGSAARDVAKKLRDQQMGIRGYRDTSLVQVLQRYIPTAAVFGGVSVALLAVIGDFLVAGCGSGILLAVTIIYQYFESLHKELANVS